MFEDEEFEDLTEEIAELSEEIQQLCLRASDENSDVTELLELANHPESLVRLSVARNPSATGEVIQKLFELCKGEDGYYGSFVGDQRIREAIAAHGNSPVEILGYIVRFDDSEFVSEIVTRNLRTPVDALVEIVEEGDVIDDLVLFNIAVRADLPLDALRILAEHDFKQVRAGVALNPSIDLEIMHLLAEDHFFECWINVAENPNCPDEILQSLEIRYAESESENANPITEIRRNRNFI